MRLNTIGTNFFLQSFIKFLYTPLAGKDQAPVQIRERLAMAAAVIKNTGFVEGVDREQFITNFMAHNDAVKRIIPARQLLIYEVKSGWQPLCEFPDVAYSQSPFQEPRLERNFGTA